eukprot:5964686-Amphidinium_carterae.4
MMTKSPVMGFRVHHPPQATIADIRHTMARRLKASLQRIVLAVGDGNGGEIPVHDTTVACSLGTLYMQLKQDNGAPYKRPAKSLHPVQDGEEDSGKQDGPKCSLSIPPSERSSQTQLLRTSIIRPKVSNKAPTIGEFVVGHYDNTKVTDVLRVISRRLKVAKERCHLYIEDERRAYLHEDLVIDNLKQLFLEVRGPAVDDRSEKPAHKGWLKRPAASDVASCPKRRQESNDEGFTIAFTKPQLRAIIQEQVSKVMEQLEALPSCLSDSILSQKPPQLLTGGTRSFRVDQSAVAKRAFTLITDDLSDLGCRKIEPKLMETLCMRDRKCAVALFQAKSRHQRLAATSAALCRMGLQEVASEVESLNMQVGTMGDNGQLRTSVVAASPEGDLARSGPSRAVQETNCDLHRLGQRLDALEAWAHALDSVTGDSALVEESSGQVKSLLQSMVRQAFEAELSSRQGGLETRLTAAESTLAASGVVEIATLRSQVELCMRMCRRGLTGNQNIQDPSSPQIAQVTSHLDAQGYLLRAQSARIEHLSELSRLQTLAVSRTWNWVSALVHASPFAVWAGAGMSGTSLPTSAQPSSPSIERAGRGQSTSQTNTQSDGTAGTRRESGADGTPGEVTILLLEQLVGLPEVREVHTPIQERHANTGGTDTLEATQRSEHTQFNTQDIAEVEAYLEQLEKKPAPPSDECGGEAVQSGEDQAETDEIFEEALQDEPGADVADAPGLDGGEVALECGLEGLRDGIEVVDLSEE